MIFAGRFRLAALDELEPEAQQRILVRFVEALAYADLELLSEETPSLYTSGVVYREEPGGRDDWDTWPIVLARGWGDCEDLAAWRLAELWDQGHDDATAHVIITDTDYHAVVQLGDGSIEDPSQELKKWRSRSYR